MNLWKAAIALSVFALSGILSGSAVSAGGSPRSASPDTLVYSNPFEVIVTASRLRLPLKQCPSATTVVGGEALRTMPRGIAVDEAMRLVPGVRIDNQADGSRVHLSIRGQGILTERGIRGIKVLLDGLPLNDPTGVAPDFYDVDWATVERIEVLRGPSAAFYGGGGSGGVINIRTEDGTGRPGSASVSATGGSYGFAKWHVDTGAAAQNVDYHLSVTRSTGDGYRDHSSFRATNLYGKVNWKPARSIAVGQVFGWTDYFDQNSEGLNATDVAANPRMANPDAGAKNEYYWTQRFTDGVLANVAISRAQNLQVSSYLRYTRFKMPVPSSVQHRSIVAPGVTVQYGIHTGEGSIRNHFTVGSDLNWQMIDEYRRENVGFAVEDRLLSNERITQRGGGVFVLDRVELGRLWGITGAVRYDDIHNQLTDLMPSDSVDLSASANFHKTTGRVGVAFTPMRTLSLYGNVGQGFLPPTTEELANNPDAFGGFNKNLTSATSVGEEVGARGVLGEAFAYEMTGFHLTTEDDFDRYRASREAGRPLETFYRNAGHSARYGVETHVRYQPMRAVAVEVAYTYSHFKYTEPDSIDGHWLPNSPEHQLGVDVSYEAPHGLFCGIGTDSQSKWYIDKENSATANAFTLLNARVGWRFARGGRDAEVSLSARNIFDKKYMAFTEPDPDGNSYQAAPLHEIFLGVRLNAPR